ncbi:MAG: AprI/Inh family metalloprotease inhibitor [Devosia sp.]|nr:AprI/Inh family metalloprotease inhibitor [Devosia sp.]
MMDLGRGAARWMTMLLVAGLLAGCSTTGDDGIAANQQPDQVAPVTDSAVSSDALPPIGGADGQVQVASADPAQITPTNQPGMPVLLGSTADPGLATGSTAAAQQPAAQGSFVSLNDVGKVSNTPGRDLSGGLTIEKLLGGWTVVSGADQCRLNLTYTTKTGTDRYRASAPGCAIPALAAVSSWQLSGTQVQLFNDADALVGALLLSGNRFIGTLSGGQAISMVG